MNQESNKIFAICCSGFDETKRAIIEVLISKIENCKYVDDLYNDVYALISDNVRSYKFRSAMTLGIPVVKFQWLVDSNKLKVLQPISNQYLLPLFKGLKFGMLGFTLEEFQSIKSRLEAKEASSCQMLNLARLNEVTAKNYHLILCKAEEMAKYKSLLCQIEDVPIVTQEWLQQTLQAKSVTMPFYHTTNNKLHVSSFYQGGCKSVNMHAIFQQDAATIMQLDLEEKIKKQHVMDADFQYLRGSIFYIYNANQITNSDFNNNNIAQCFAKQLKKLIILGNGLISPVLASATTHIILDVRYSPCSLQLIQSLRQFNSHVSILHPNYLLDCLSFKRRLNEAEYSVNQIVCENIHLTHALFMKSRCSMPQQQQQQQMMAPFSQGTQGGGGQNLNMINSSINYNSNGNALLQRFSSFNQDGRTEHIINTNNQNQIQSTYLFVGQANTTNAFTKQQSSEMPMPLFQSQDNKAIEFQFQRKSLRELTQQDPITKDFKSRSTIQQCGDINQNVNVNQSKSKQQKSSRKKTPQKKKSKLQKQKMSQQKLLMIKSQLYKNHLFYIEPQFLQQKSPHYQLMHDCKQKILENSGKFSNQFNAQNENQQHQQHQQNIVINVLPDRPESVQIILGQLNQATSQPKETANQLNQQSQQNQGDTAFYVSYRWVNYTMQKKHLILSSEAIINEKLFYLFPFKYSVPIKEFKGKKFVVAGYNFKDKQILLDLVDILGGSGVGDITNAQFLVCDNSDCKKYKQVLKSKYLQCIVKCINSSFLLDCIQEGRFLASEDYEFKEGMDIADQQKSVFDGNDEQADCDPYAKQQAFKNITNDQKFQQSSQMPKLMKDNKHKYSNNQQENTPNK